MKRKIKGIALIWSLFLMIILLIVSGTMVSSITKESRMSTDISGSTQAYANARTGTDWAIDYLSTKESIPPSLIGSPVTFEFPDAITNQVTIKFVADPSSPNNYPVTITSIGTYGTAVRVIETKADLPTSKNKVTDILPMGATGQIGALPNNFNIEFDIWGNTNSTLDTENEYLTLTRGLGAGGADPSISIRTSGNKIQLIVTDDGGIPLSATLKSNSGTTSGISESDFIVSNSISYKYHVSVRYTKNERIVATITERDSENKLNPAENCGYAVLSDPALMTNITGAFNKISMTNNSGVVPQYFDGLTGGQGPYLADEADEYFGNADTYYDNIEYYKFD